MPRKTRKDSDEAVAVQPAQDGAEPEQLLANPEPEPAEEIGAGPQDELAQAKEAAETNYELYVRARAELENVVRRHERERGERAKYAAEALAKDLLPTVDNLERAIEHATLSGGNEGGILEGVELVHQGLLSALEKHGIQRVEALGQPFDPTQHEAVAIVESGDAEPNTVVAEHRAGYRLAERLLRASMVAVAKAPAAAEE
jgi:molecular chaperone GrpE